MIFLKNLCGKLGIDLQRKNKEKQQGKIKTLPSQYLKKFKNCQPQMKFAASCKEERILKSREFVTVNGETFNFKILLCLILRSLNLVNAYWEIMHEK